VEGFCTVVGASEDVVLKKPHALRYILRQYVTWFFNKIFYVLALSLLHTAYRTAYFLILMQFIHVVVFNN
jgi:hypothetical protein